MSSQPEIYIPKLIHHRSQFEPLYKESPPSFFVNDNDPDLKPIEIFLPPCPKLFTIDGFGLDPKDQKWAPPEVPKYLKELNDQKNPDPNYNWRIVLENWGDFKEELAWIEQQWEYRLTHKWHFIHGEAVPICGDHFFYLVACKIDNETKGGLALPDYRRRNWKHFWAKRQFMIDPDCMGYTYPKMRREGATGEECSSLLNFATMLEGIHNGIQSKTDGDAESVFNIQLVPMWQELPFWWKPSWDGQVSPTKELSFDQPSKKFQDTITKGHQNYLRSLIDFKSSVAGAYDGRKIFYFLNDECGKTLKADILQRHRVLAKCVTVGGGKKIVGFIANTSTVADMEKGGGDRFEKLCEGSHYHQRTANGRTLTGLYNLFIPSTEGLEGFIDEYGNDVIEDPEKPVRGMDGGLIVDKEGKPIGSRRWLMQARQALLDKGNFTDWAEEVRMYPLTWRECWTKSSKGNGFNLEILTRRIEELKYNPPKCLRWGEFYWEGNPGWHNLPRPDGQDFKGRVLWRDLPRDIARFEISYLFPNPAQSNKWRYDYNSGLIVPANTRHFVAGGDAYRTREKIVGVESKGALGIKRRYDPTIDLPHLNPLEINPATGDFNHVTNRFACVYLHKPAVKEVFGEDAILSCVYYGCELNPEVQAEFLVDYFYQRGFRGFLFHKVNPETMKRKDKAGTFTGPGAIDDIFVETGSWISHHAMRENHIQYLQQCYDIGFDMGPYDLFAACGQAHLADNSSKYLDMNEPAEVNIGSVFDAWGKQKEEGGFPEEEKQILLNRFQNPYQYIPTIVINGGPSAKELADLAAEEEDV